MKLTTLSVLLASTTLAFGQANLQTRVSSPAGTVQLSALSMSQVLDDERAEREKLTALRLQMAGLTTRYKNTHPSVIMLQTQIDELEAGLKPEKQIIQLKGNVEIRTGTITVVADEADYHAKTGEIEARGNVRITPISTASK